MTTELTDVTRALPNRGDAIRVVPVATVDEIGVFTDAAAGPAPAAQLTYRGGPLLTNVEVFTIFWGKGWKLPANKKLAGQINGFFDVILGSELIDQLGEYSRPGLKIGHGTHTGTATITTPNVGLSVSDGAIQHFLQQQLSSHPSMPQPSKNTLYFVYLPPGVSVTQGGGQSCKVFCGYHSDINGTMFYAVMPYPGCVGCTGSLSAFDALTATSSHELCEAITDPVPGMGWYDDNFGEIGDICAWKNKTVQGYTVQLEWSNKKKSCA